MNCGLYHTLMTEDNFAVASRIKWGGLETVFASHKHTHQPISNIHPSIFWELGTGAHPSCLQARGGVHPGWVTSSLWDRHPQTDEQTHTHTHSHLQPVEVQMTPKCMSLECGSKENLRRERTHGENMQPPPRQATVDFKQWAHSKK